LAASLDNVSNSSLVNPNCSAVVLTLGNNLLKFSTNATTPATTKPIPIDAKATLNPFTAPVPVVNAALIESPIAVNDGPNNLLADTTALETSLSPDTTPITPNSFFSASSIALDSEPKAIKADDTAPTAPVKPLNVSTKAVALCSLSKPSNCNSMSFNCDLNQQKEFQTLPLMLLIQPLNPQQILGYY